MSKDHLALYQELQAKGGAVSALMASEGEFVMPSEMLQVNASCNHPSLYACRVAMGQYQASRRGVGRIAQYHALSQPVSSPPLLPLLGLLSLITPSHSMLLNQCHSGT